MKVLIRNARLAFPILFKADTVNGEGAPAYSCSLLLTDNATASMDGGATFDPAEQVIHKAIDAVGKAKWKEKAPAILKALIAQDKVCLHDGDLKGQYEGFEETRYVSARSQVSQKPRVLDRDKTELEEADGRPYAGCYVNASLELWPQDNKYGKRVNARVRIVQFVKDGDAFGASAPVSDDEVDDFAALEVPEDAVDDLV